MSENRWQKSRRVETTEVQKGDIKDERGKRHVKKTVCFVSAIFNKSVTKEL